MRILIDIGHPGHVHLLKNFYLIMKEKGHEIFVTVKDNKIQKALLDKYNMNYIVIGQKQDSLIGKAFSQIIYNIKIVKLIIKNKIDIGIGSSITLAHASRLTRMKSILLDDDDDEVQMLFVKYAHPYCDTLLTPSALKNNRKSKKSIFYDAYHELAYLHPKYFKPDNRVLNELSLKESDVFFIMRFNVFKAHHDVGVSGLTLEQKKELVNLLKPYGKIFITTEREIEPELEEYRLSISPEKIHSLMYYATLFLGDSQTMTTESALLGTPALKCNSFAGKLSVPNELENRYRLCYSYQISNFDSYKDKIKESLENKRLRDEWKDKKKIMLNEKINTTDFFVWFVEAYPKSVEVMKSNPDYQKKFR